LFGCLYAPIEGLWGWAIVLGLGQGGTFSLALTLIVLRSRDSHVAANLSSVAQGFGYTLASMGPFAVGIVHDWTGGWSAVRLDLRGHRHWARSLPAWGPVVRCMCRWKAKSESGH
jgi:cyanate permease